MQALRAPGAQGAGGDMEAQGIARLQHLNALRDQLVSGANGLPLAALRAEVTSAVASTLAYTSDARAASTSPASSRAATEASLQQASAEAHRTVTDFMHDFYDRRIFDPYLKFASEKDKEEYQRREEEWKEKIEKAHAEHTPEGELRAMDLSIAQMEDAGAHGAKSSPQYQSMMDGMQEGRRRLARQIAASSKETEAKQPDAAPEKDSQDAVKMKSAIPPEMLASLRAAEISVADQTQEGHGILSRSASPASGRSPA